MSARDKAIQAVVDGTLADPHSVLGAHPVKGGVVICAYRPDAVSVTAKANGSGSVELEQLHPGGVFAGELKGAELPLAYELEVAYGDGQTFTLKDPYAFTPTLGELDIHLAGEGRHEEIYEHLGAHTREVDGVQGTAFAVWAPERPGGLGGRRLQLLGRPAAPHARARLERDLGALRPRRRRRRALQVRDPRRRAARPS